MTSVQRMKRLIISLCIVTLLANLSLDSTAFSDPDLLPVNRSNITIALSGLGSSFHLIPDLSSDAEEYVVGYSSSDESIAVVDCDGWIRAMSAGSAQVTVRTSLEREASVSVYVDEMDLIALPDELKMIESEAFRGDRFQRLDVPCGVETIGEYAFADNDRLLFVSIPDSVTEIAPNAFSGDTDVCILCGSGSYAEQWARSHMVAWQPRDIPETVKIESISVPGDFAVEIGTSATITPVITPASAANNGLHWYSSDTEVATVSKEGVVSAVGIGQTIIAVQATDGSGVSASLILTVQPVSTGVSVTYSELPSIQNIGATNAVLARKIGVNGHADIHDVSYVGCYLYDGNGALLGSKREVPTPLGSVIQAWYDVNEELGVILTEGTKYTYRFVAVIDDTEYWSDMYSFTTTSGSTNISVSFSANPRQVIGSRNATVARTVSVTGASIQDVETVGCYLYDASGNLLASKREKPRPLNGVINVWYDVKNELGVTLDPDETYGYQFVAVVDGAEYYSDFDTFALKVYTPNEEKIQAVIDRAYAWLNYTWVAPVDIPVYNNLYDSIADGAYYQTEYYFRAGTEMHGLPYTLSNSKYNIEQYAALSNTAKAAATTFTYSGVLMWGPKYAADCSELVSDCLYYGDPVIGTDGQTYFTSSKAYLYEAVSWEEVRPGDALGKTGHTMIVVDVSGEYITTIEQCGNGDDTGALHCTNVTARPEGGFYVCGTCEACAGANKGATVLRIRPKSELSVYTVYRYLPLYQ